MDKIREIVKITCPDNGITVYVEIDYIHNQISLMDKDGRFFKKKQWLFAGRGVEYMNGWIDILHAMEYAIMEGKRMYEEELAKVSAFKEKQTIDLIINLSEKGTNGHHKNS